VRSRAPKRSPRVRLRVAPVYRSALGVYRARFGRVVGTAAIVLVPVAAVQVVATDLSRQGRTPGTPTQLLLVVISLTVSGVETFAGTFYAGVLDRTVGATRGEYPDGTVRTVFRQLPYRRLIGADLLYWALVVVGSLALLIPGLIVLTLFSIVAPVMLIEDRGIIDSFRRSYRLVRPNFWRVAATVLLPTILASVLTDELLASASHPSVLHELIVECAFAALVGSFVTLLEVQTAYHLIELEKTTPPGGETGEAAAG
jgi:hypothetical protein